MLYNYNPLDKENYPTMIWLAILFVAITWIGIEAPLQFVLEYQIEEHNLWWDGIFSTIFMLDVFFRVTNKLKLPERTKDLLEGFDKEQVPYVKSLWFPVDLITSLPFDIIISISGLDLPYRVVAAFRLLRLLRISKLRSIIVMIDSIPRVFKVSFIATSILLTIHWIACGWMLITPRPDLDTYSFYNISLYWVITTLTTVGYGDIAPVSNIGRIFTMGVMIIGVASYGIIIGNFSRMIVLADKYKEEKKEKLNNLHQFMKYYNIPYSLQKQTFSFYNHLLNKNISEQDGDTIKDLPQALQNELNIYMKIKFIRNVHIFKDCSTPCLKMIAQRLEQTFHSPGEYIIKKGDVGDEMFIIGHGDLQVVTAEKVLAELKAGQFFGEMALLEDTIRNADVQTKAYCDLYTFKKSDFLEIIEKYPNLEEKFKSRYHKRLSDNKNTHRRAA